MQAPQQQSTYHYVLTLELPGRASVTWSGTVTPGTADTRHGIYTLLRETAAQQRPEFAHANVVFFALEPNTL